MSCDKHWLNGVAPIFSGPLHLNDIMFSGEHCAGRDQELKGAEVKNSVGSARRVVWRGR